MGSDPNWILQTRYGNSNWFPLLLIWWKLLDEPFGMLVNFLSDNRSPNPLGSKEGQPKFIKWRELFNTWSSTCTEWPQGLLPRCEQSFAESLPDPAPALLRVFPPFFGGCQINVNTYVRNRPAACIPGVRSTLICRLCCWMNTGDDAGIIFFREDTINIQFPVCVGGPCLSSK